MTTTYTTEERVSTLEPVSAWESPRFQRFAAITVCTALLLSVVATSCLAIDVTDIMVNKLGLIQNQLNDYETRKLF